MRRQWLTIGVVVGKRWLVVTIGVGMVREREKEKKRKGKKDERKKGDVVGDRKIWVLGFVLKWMVKIKCENGEFRWVL